MSAQRKAQRRFEIEAVRANAREAFLAGRPKSSCPYRYANQYQWENEYDQLVAAAEREHETAKRSREDALIDFAQSRINDLPEGDEQYAMQALLDLVLYLKEEAA